MTSFLQNLVNAMQWGSFYALIALGYSMVYGVLMLFNFAHGDIFMVGAYIGFFISSGLIALSALGSLVLPNWLILLNDWYYPGNWKPGLIRCKTSQLPCLDRINHL